MTPNPETYRALLAYALRAREEAIAWTERLQGVDTIAADRCRLVAEIQERLFTGAGLRAGETTP